VPPKYRRAGIHANGGHVAPADGSVSIEDEQSALTDPVRMAIHPVCAGYSAFGFEVRQEGKPQFPIAGKGEMTADAVHRNTEQGGVKAPKL
jgi:hypothetical protein